MAADAVDAWVVDALALATLLFVEPEADQVAERLEGAELFAPSLIRYELASVCLKKCLAYPDLREALLRQLDLYPRLGIVEAEVPASELARVSQEVGVTAYDAAYLWLAQHTGASLLTLDGDMADAAVRWGLPLIG